MAGRVYQIKELDPVGLMYRPELALAYSANTRVSYWRHYISAYPFAFGDRATGCEKNEL
jgi:hypothetical protein